jgi:hypothetical protein
LDKEQAFSDWIYKVSSYTLSSLMKNRSELLKEPEAEDEAAADAGVPFTDPIPVTQ